MVNDPIADMLTRIRNALMIGRETVEIPVSRLKIEIARILKEEGYVKNYQVTRDEPQANLRVTLKYDDDRQPIITTVKRISKPGRRVYVGRDEIPWVLSGMGISILSTPRGIMTGQQARRLRVGGEVICYVW